MINCFEYIGLMFHFISLRSGILIITLIIKNVGTKRKTAINSGITRSILIKYAYVIGDVLFDSTPISKLDIRIY